jgi:hypothetical protein
MVQFWYERGTTMRFTVISDPNHCAGGCTDFRVHRPDCRDIAKHTRNPRFGFAGCAYEVEAETPEAAVASEVADFQEQEMGFTASDFTILPCCRDSSCRRGG